VNLNPSLNNDCEVDWEVKKPLLHDLFDLLGLPVSNTGLSLFTIWTSSKHIEENEKSSKLNRFTKKKSETGREKNSFSNLTSEIQATVIMNESSFTMSFLSKKIENYYEEVNNRKLRLMLKKNHY
jgi:tubulin polyglutamylase TTLL2